MNDEQQLAPVDEQKKLNAIIGGVLVPLFIIIVGNFCCGEQKSVGRYFIIQYYSKALWYKINYLCTDSISDSKMKDIDINKTWKEKPIELLSNE